MRLILLYLILILPLKCLRAQQEELTFLHFNNANGLDYQNVQCITQDSSGFIWIGTSEGLLKYDGYSFQVFRHSPSDSLSLSCNNVSDIVVLDNQNLLVGTYECGLNIFHIPSSKTERIPVGTFDRRTLSMFKDKEGFVWLGLNDGSLARFDTERKCLVELKLKPQSGSKRFYYCHGFSEHLSNPNLLWVASLSGLVLLDKRDLSYTLFQASDSVPGLNPVLNRTRYPLHLGKDQVWMGSWGGGVIHFNQTTRQWKHYLIDSTPPLNGGKNIVLSISKKSEEELWVATVDSGLGIFNMLSGRYRFLDVASSSKYSGIRTLKRKAQTLYKDNRNRVWVGFETGLAIENKSLVFEKFTIPTPSKTNLKHLHYPFYFLEDSIRNGIWIAPFHGDGLYFYDLIKNRYSLFEPNSDVLLPRGMIWNKDGNILLLTANALWQIEPNSDVLLPRGMIWNKDGNILLLTANALWQFDPNQSRFQKSATPDTIKIEKYGGYQLLAGKEGTIFIGTLKFGVFEWNECTQRVQHYYQQKNKANSLLENGPIYALCLDTLQNLWVGTENGATLIHRKSGKYTHFSHSIGPKNKGFKGIYSIVSDNKGLVWMQSVSSGLLAVDPNKNYRVQKGYNVGDGLATNTIFKLTAGPDSMLLIYTSQGLQYFNPRSRSSVSYSAQIDFPFLPTEWDAFQMLNKSLYFGSLNCWYRLIDAAYSDNHVLPTPRISRISVFDKEFNSSVNSYNTLEFNYQQNFIRIHYSNFDFTETEKIRLGYQIQGLSQDTFYTEKGSNVISLTGLAPGKYTLQVWTEYPESGRRSVACLTDVRITPPWWLSWWFFVLTGNSIGLGVYALYRFRLNQAKETSNLKRKLAEMENTALRSQMNPHFLFNSLNSVNFYIQNNELKKASQHLKKFAKLVRVVLNNSRNNEILLSDELDALKLYLDFEEVRFDKHFSYTFEIDPEIDLHDVFIPPLLLQPFVENAIWHGIMQKENGGELSIRIKNTHQGIQFIIEDNGIGRSKAEELKSKSALKQKSHGLDITNERIRLFNATHAQSLRTEIIDLFDNTGNSAGTRVIITLNQESK